MPRAPRLRLLRLRGSCCRGDPRLHDAAGRRRLPRRLQRPGDPVVSADRRRRCAGSRRRSPTRISRPAFRNGAIVTLCASSIALVIGAAFAFAIDRYQFRAKRAASRRCCSRRWWCRISPSGLGFLILAAQIGATQPTGWSSPATWCWCCPSCCAASMSRSATSTGGSSWRPPASARRRGRVLLTVTLPLLAAGPRQRLAVRRHPVVQRVHRLAVRDGATHADPCRSRCTTMSANMPTRRWRRSPSCTSSATALLLTFANRFLGLGKVLNVEHGR